MMFCASTFSKKSFNRRDNEVLVATKRCAVIYRVHHKKQNPTHPLDYFKYTVEQHSFPLSLSSPSRLNSEFRRL